MEIQGSVASVVAAIRDEADDEIEKLEEQTATSIAEARRAMAPVVIADRETRIRAAHRDAAEHIAQQEWEGRRAEIEQREAWLQRVAARGRERLAAERDPAIMQRLVEEAARFLPEAARDVTPAPSGGCTVAAGDLVFDNSFDARARRFEPAWRRALNEMYRI